MQNRQCRWHTALKASTGLESSMLNWTDAHIGASGFSNRDGEDRLAGALQGGHPVLVPDAAQ